MLKTDGAFVLFKRFLPLFCRVMLEPAGFMPGSDGVRFCLAPPRRGEYCFSELPSIDIAVACGATFFDRGGVLSVDRRNALVWERLRDGPLAGRQFNIHPNLGFVRRALLNVASGGSDHPIPFDVSNVRGPLIPGFSTKAELWAYGLGYFILPGSHADRAMKAALAIDRAKFRGELDGTVTRRLLMNLDEALADVPLI